MADDHLEPMLLVGQAAAPGIGLDVLLPILRSLPAPESRSSVEISTNSKGMAQVTVKAYDGVTLDDLQALKDNALKTYETLIRELGQRAEFQ